MTLHKTLLTVVSLCISIAVMAQCYPDRHNTSADATWVSCTLSPSPNGTRGDSHWIHYDLGEDKKLGAMHIWNVNHPDGLDSGAKLVVVDYSDDGQSWTEWGSLEVGMAEGSGFYEGVAGPDFDGLQTSHLLLTIVENHGGTCAGFSEIRIETSEISAVTDIAKQAFKLYPNPAMAYTKLQIETEGYEVGQVMVLDEIGKRLHSQDVTLPGGVHEVKVVFPQDLPSGQYFLRLITDKRDHTQDFSIISN